MIISMALPIIHIRILIMGISIHVILNNSLVRYNNTKGSVCRSATTCQGRCDRKTEYHRLIFRNCSKLCLRFHDWIFGGRISIKIAFVFFETIHHFESTS